MNETKEVVNAIQSNTNWKGELFEVQSKDCCKCGWKSEVKYKGETILKVEDEYDWQWDEVTSSRVIVDKTKFNSEVKATINAVFNALMVDHEMFETPDGMIVSKRWDGFLDLWAKEFLCGGELDDRGLLKQFKEEPRRISDFPKIY